MSHNYDHLFHRYRVVSRLTWPAEVARAVSRLAVWGTDLRYTPSRRYAGDVGAVFEAAEVVLTWLRGRL